MKAPGSILWQGSEKRRQASQMQRFLDFVTTTEGLIFHNWDELYRWSIEDTASFWKNLAEFVQIKWIKKPSHTYDPPESPSSTLGAKWFKDGVLNFAENLLPEVNDREVLIAKAEGHERRVLTAKELHRQVAVCAASLKLQGVVPGDRVAGVLVNGCEAIVAMLATASLGAVWASCSPDFGVGGIVDRLGQIEPKVLFCSTAYRYGGKLCLVDSVIDECCESLPSLVCVVAVDHLGESYHLNVAHQSWEQFVPLGQQNDLVFVHRAFDDPLYILFSSGTTGVPKCIVHGVGGTLLQHKKELMLHTDLGPGDRLFYYTTCGWMMWNWMVSALSVDASLYVYDGSPNAPDFSSLWQTIQDEKITVFGTSPKYIAYSIGQGMCPKEDYELSQLRTILSTGAPLLPEHFQWIYNAVDGDIHLASISGGTDIVSCFMLGNPLLPVRSGEIQGPGLGMAIEAWDSEGKPTRGAKGELVCVKPFPSMPLYFWKDSDGSKIREAYFSHYPQCEVWRHGDFVELTDWGGVIVYGRSDATLNPGGVRIGTAELYRQVESMPEVAEAVAVARKNNGDVDILLFVKLNTGFTMDEILDKKIRHTIRTHLTPRHLPKQIFAVTDIPYTRSGKKMEMVVSCIMNQESIDQFTAISNPESLPQYFKIQHELKEKR